MTLSALSTSTSYVFPLTSAYPLSEANDQANHPTTFNHQLKSAIAENDIAAVTTLFGEFHVGGELASSTQEIIMTALEASDPDAPKLEVKVDLATKLMGDRFSIDDSIHGGQSVRDIAQELHEETGDPALLNALTKSQSTQNIPATPKKLTSSFAGDLETRLLHSSPSCSPLSSPSSPPYPTPLRRSLSASKLSLSADFSDASEKVKNHQKYPNHPTYRQAIHNRGISLIEGRVTESVATMLKEKSWQIGKVITNNHLKSQQGVGSGILIAPNLFLTSRHCIADSSNHSVVFGANEAGMKGEAFTILKTHAAESDIAQQHGLACGSGGDFIILELGKAQNIVGNSARFPGEIYGYTPLKTPTMLAGTNTELYFLGYSAGSHLKLSESNVRTRELTDFIERHKHNFPVMENKLLIWNNGKTHGYIQNAQAVNANTGINTNTGDKVALNVASPDRSRQFATQDGAVLREGGVVANQHSEFYVGLPMQIGHDHIKTGHHASQGSSGGIYFTQDGTLYAVQRGMIDTGFKHPDHLAYFPWHANFITIYDDQLTLEGRDKEKGGGLKIRTPSKLNSNFNIQSPTPPQKTSQSTPLLFRIESLYQSILKKEAEYKVKAVTEQYRQIRAGDKKHALHVLNCWLDGKRIELPKKADAHKRYWEDINSDLLNGATKQFLQEAEDQFKRTFTSRQDIALGNRQAVARFKENYCILDVRIWSWGVNQAFIEGGASHGARFWLATPFPEGILEQLPTTTTATMNSTTFLEAIKPAPDAGASQGTTLWHSGEDRPTWYALEVAGLLDLGYVLQHEKGENYLIPPNHSSSSQAPRSVGAAVSTMGYEIYLKSAT